MTVFALFISMGYVHIEKAKGTPAPVFSADSVRGCPHYYQRKQPLSSFYPIFGWHPLEKRATQKSTLNFYIFHLLTVVWK